MSPSRHNKRRPRILLCWGYHRRGWIEVFERLNESFEFLYLYYSDPGDEAVAFTECSKLYWHDFASGKDVLDRVRPDGVIFMSTDSGFAIGLNAACKSRCVPTFVLQHGLTASLVEYLKLHQTRRVLKYSLGTHRGGGSFRTLIFLLRSISFGQLACLPRLTFYLWVLRYWGNSWKAQRWAGFSLTRPDQYICFTRANAQICRELHPGSESVTHYIGIPEFDNFFGALPEDRACEFYLLLDQPWAENPFAKSMVSRDQIIHMYRILSNYARKQGKRLYVKLHPESYSSNWLPNDEEIVWIKDCDIVQLLSSACGIFGGGTTLILPALYLKPCYLIDGSGSEFIQAILASGLVAGCDLLELSEENIHFLVPDRTSGGFQAFIEEYLGPTDGGAALRLQEILIDLV